MDVQGLVAILKFLEATMTGALLLVIGIASWKALRRPASAAAWLQAAGAWGYGACVVANYAVNTPGLAYRGPTALQRLVWSMSQTVMTAAVILFVWGLCWEYLIRSRESRAARGGIAGGDGHHPK